MGDHTIAAPCTKALFREILENPAVVSRIYAAPDDCALDDRVAWHAANPTLGTIKQLSYMENQVERRPRLHPNGHPWPLLQRRRPGP